MASPAAVPPRTSHVPATPAIEMVALSPAASAPVVFSVTLATACVSVADVASSAVAPSILPWKASALERSAPSASFLSFSVPAYAAASRLSAQKRKSYSVSGSRPPTVKVNVPPCAPCTPSACATKVLPAASYTSSRHRSMATSSLSNVEARVPMPSSIVAVMVARPSVRVPPSSSWPHDASMAAMPSIRNKCFFFIASFVFVWLLLSIAFSIGGLSRSKRPSFAV